MSSIRYSLTRLVALSALLLPLCGAGASAHSDKMKILHAFCGEPTCSDGDRPNPLISDSAGNLFGTTLGGVNALGEVFELHRRANGGYRYEILYTFIQVIDPVGALVIDTKGNLYGVAEGLDQKGNAGQIFELSRGKSGWTAKALYNFCQDIDCTDGFFPQAGLAYANQRSGAPYDGKSPLFGTTAMGGTHGGGTVFEMLPGKKAWTHTKLYDFCVSGNSCTDGMYPQAQLLLDSSGNLYGATTYGGKNGGDGTLSGTVFELSPAGNSWTESVLYSFCSAYACADGAWPQSPLAFDASGNLYGFTTAGGATCMLANEYQGCGIAYEIVPNGTNSQETVLYDFCATTGCRDGAFPEGTPYLDGNGNLFAMAGGGGNVQNDWYHLGGGTMYEFSLADPDNTFRVLYRFCKELDCPDGAYPEGFVGDPSGVIVGTAAAGGPDAGGEDGGGTAFSLTP